MERGDKERGGGVGREEGRKRGEQAERAPHLARHMCLVEAGIVTGEER